MEEIEQRIDQINNLRRKYGNSIKDIFEYRQKIQNRLDEILNRDEKVVEIDSDSLNYIIFFFFFLREFKIENNM